MIKWNKNNLFEGKKKWMKKKIEGKASGNGNNQVSKGNTNEVMEKGKLKNKL